MSWNVDEICLFALQQEFGARVAGHLELSLSEHEERSFEDGECKIRTLQSVRDRDVYVLSSLYSDAGQGVHDRLVRTLLFLGGLKDAGAGRLTAVLPYLCYARKDRRTKSRDPVSSRYVAAMLEAAGADRVLTVDVHNLAAYENAFRIPTEHLSAAPILADHLATRIDSDAPVVISPDVGGVKRAEAFRTILEQRLARGVTSGFMEKRRSGGVISGDRLVAEVSGRAAILVDDLVSSGGTLVRAAAACRAQGAATVVAVATHGVFSAESDQQLADSPLDQLLITDCVPVPRPGRVMTWPGLEVISIAPLLAEAIARLHTGGSLIELGAWE